MYLINPIFSQLAQTIMYRHYPQNFLQTITFDNEFTWLNKEIRKNLFGGLAACFTRHAETATGDINESFPPVVYKTPNGSPVRLISQLDVNSLYPTIMRDTLPTGHGIFYINEDGHFTAQPMAKNDGSNASKISLDWINSIQGQYVTNGEIVPIMTAINGKEKRIGQFDLDGYVEFEGKRIGFDFFGCRWHPCQDCTTECAEGPAKAIKDAERVDFLREELDSYIVMKECHYRRIMSKNDPSLLTFAWNKDPLTQDEMIDGIMSGELFGIAKVDIICPDEAKEKVIFLIFDTSIY